DIFMSYRGYSPKFQAVTKESGCVECHVKDGKEKKEENFSRPYHPECARCHTVVKPKMKGGDCEGCHQMKSPTRVEGTNLITGFFHDSTHEDDNRPKDQKDPAKDKKFLTKDGKKLKCQFCHDVDRVAKLVDVQIPLQSRCTPCHNANKTAVARALTSEELAKLKPDTQTTVEKK